MYYPKNKRPYVSASNPQGACGSNGPKMSTKTIKVINTSAEDKPFVIGDASSIIAAKTGTRTGEGVEIKGSGFDYISWLKTVVSNSRIRLGSFRVKVDEGKEAQFDEQFRLRQDNSNTTDTNTVFEITPSDYLSEYQQLKNIVTIDQCFEMNYASALDSVIPANSTLVITLHIVAELDTSK